MGNMKQGGASVGMMSHECEKYETGWGKCGKKKGRVRMKSVRVVTVMNLKKICDTSWGSMNYGLGKFIG